MTGILVLVAVLVALVIGAVIAFRRKDARGGRSGVDPDDQEPSPRVQ